MATAYDRRSTRPRLDSLRSTTSSSIPPPSSPSHPARPPSPSFSQTTSGSLANGTNAPHLIINRSDLRDSLRAYEDLMEAGKTYRRALLEKSQASARLAGALEVVSRLKGADHSGPGFMATAGFHYVVSNSEQVLGDSFYKSFEIPLLHTLDTYRQETIDRQASYEQALVAKTKLIREIESANLKSAGKKAAKGKGGRDLNSFRKTLELLQAHVHELDMLKMEYHGEVLDAEDEIWETILGKVGMVVKTQLEMMDKISMKANDSVLEPLLAANPDPFEAYAQPDQDALMFSILPPIGILQPTSSSQNLRSQAHSTHSSPRAPTSSQPTTPRASSSPLLPQNPDSPSSADDGFLSPRRRNSFDASAEEDLITPRKSTFGGQDVPRSESLESITPNGGGVGAGGGGAGGGLRKVLSVIGETLNGGSRSREASSTAEEGDDRSTGESTIGRSGVGEKVVKKKERGLIPFPNTPSQDSLRVGSVVNGGQEEEEEERVVNDVTGDGVVGK